MGGASAAVTALIDSERARWFNWVPVLLGLGIALYFWLPTEPDVMMALAPFPAALVLVGAWRKKGTVAFVLSSAILSVASGLAIAKLRTEWVRAPVLERQLGNVEVRGFVELVEPKPTKGQRITLRVVSLGKLTPDQLIHGGAQIEYLNRLINRDVANEHAAIFLVADKACLFQHAKRFAHRTPRDPEFFRESRLDQLASRGELTRQDGPLNSLLHQCG